MGVAVITGAGSGMGRATAELYLDRDWQVIAVDVSDTSSLLLGVFVCLEA